MTAPVPGQFVWFDLMTHDADAAKRFYGELVGWKATPWPGGDYEMWTAGEQQVGGMMALPKDAPGATPHWLSYAAVANVDASVEKVQRLGGKVLVAAKDIPDAGRFAVVTDPQGAMFALYKPSSEMPPPKRDALGHFSWAELNTTDWKGAWTFYSELFGWKSTSTMDMGEGFGEYAMFGLDTENSIGGMSNSADAAKAPPYWLHYMNVPNVDEAAARTTQMGGKVLAGPMDVPGGDRVVQCMDPQGAMFALYAAGKR